jgi:parallel beta-helix repeat protein
MKSKTNHVKWLLCVLLLLVAVCTAAAGKVIYVDASAGGANNGSSWADAHWCLQGALADARSGDEIRVANGIYKPDRHVVVGHGHRIIASGDRTATFQLISDVVIKGGFAGFGEPDPDAQDIDLYKTILSGDLNGDDGPDFTNNSENSYHVVTGSGTNETAVLDGFTVTGGNADAELGTASHGGGMYNDDGSPTVTHCTFLGNAASWRGGGMYNGQSSPTVTHSTFIGNAALAMGGGMYNYGGSPTVTHCTFVGNVAYAHGGGITNFGGSLTLTNCRFVENSTTSRHGNGGGMSNTQSSHPTVTNCMFVKNSVDGNGGGISSHVASNPILTNCIFIENSGDLGGALSSVTSSAPTLTNCILWGDSPDEIHLSDGNTVITYSDIQGGWPGEGNINADPLFVDADGADDVIGTKDDNLRLLPDSPCIDAGDNSAVPTSVLTDLDGNPRVTNGTVDMGAYESGIAPPVNVYYVVDAINGDDNNDGLSRETAFATIQKGIDTAEDGGVVVVYPGVYQEEVNFLGKALTVQGVFQSPAGVPVLQNPGDFAVSFYYGEGRDSILKNFIIKNSFIAVFIARSSPTIGNVTVVENRYGIDAYAGSEPDISNSIFWNNAGSDLFGCLARYSCIEQFAVGEGNIDDDPFFVDPVVGDYRLASERGRYWPEHDVWVLDKVTSPCVDGGDPNADPLDEPVPNGGRINMGAYGGTAEASLSLGYQSRPLPGQVSNPSPADGAEGVETNVRLSWTAGLNTIWYEVYFGTNPTPGAAELVSERQTDTTYPDTTDQFMGWLEPHTTFYWRVDAVNCNGKTVGEIWTFTTGSSPPPKGRPCFIANTPVWVNGALVQISNVVSGQMVGKTYCNPTIPCLEKIEKVQEHEGTFECRDIVLESGNRIGVVDAHCFMLDSGQWIAAQNLTSGLRLKTLTGTVGIKSVAIRAVPFVGKVYNLKIKGADQYLVGEDGLIVRDY